MLGEAVPCRVDEARLYLARTTILEVVEDDLVPHLRGEHLTLAQGQELWQDVADRLQREAASLSKKSDDDQGLDVVLVVQEPVRRDDVRWGEEADASVV